MIELPSNWMQLTSDDRMNWWDRKLKHDELMRLAADWAIHAENVRCIPWRDRTPDWCDFRRQMIRERQAEAARLALEALALQL